MSPPASRLIREIVANAESFFPSAAKLYRTRCGPCRTSSAGKRNSVVVPISDTLHIPQLVRRWHYHPAFLDRPNYVEDVCKIRTHCEIHADDFAPPLGTK